MVHLPTMVRQAWPGQAQRRSMSDIASGAVFLGDQDLKTMAWNGLATVAGGQVLVRRANRYGFFDAATDDRKHSSGVRRRSGAPKMLL
jgi:hypothetical protein